MNNFQMNRPCCRPYNVTCGMTREQKSECRNPEKVSHIDHLEPAMAYVPWQNFTTTYDLDYALKVGTVFPQLCKPFCGKRGIRK